MSLVSETIDSTNVLQNYNYKSFMVCNCVNYDCANCNCKNCNCKKCNYENCNCRNNGTNDTFTFEKFTGFVAKKIGYIIFAIIGTWLLL